VAAEPVIRPARPGDSVDRVIRDAFVEDGEKLVALWSELERSDLLRGSIVAERDGEVVGHVGLSHAWLDARRELVDVWLLSPLSVVRQDQGVGIGTRLLEAAVDAARASGTPLLLLEGDPGYYRVRGFELGAAYGLIPASARTPAPAFQVVRFESHEDWMTGQLIYPDLWWRYDAAGLRDPLLAQIENAQIEEEVR